MTTYTPPTHTQTRFSYRLESGFSLAEPQKSGSLKLFINSTITQKQLELVPPSRDLNKGSTELLYSPSLCVTKSWLFLLSSQLLLCLSVRSPGCATGPVPSVVPRVSTSSWPPACGSHGPEPNLQLTVKLHTELPEQNVFFNKRISEIVGKERVSRRKHRKVQQQLLGLSRAHPAGMCRGFLWSPGCAVLLHHRLLSFCPGCSHVCVLLYSQLV